MGFLERGINKPSDSLSDYTLMFAGEKKSGKTSLSAQFPDSFILEFEPGNAKHIECEYKDITSFSELDQALSFLEKNKDFCQTLVIDDVPSVYELVMVETRRYLKLSPEDKGSFDMWRVQKTKFNDVVYRIQNLPFGKIYTAHDKVREIELRSGRKMQQLETSMSGQCKEILDKYITLTGFIFNEKEGKFLQIEGDEWVKANNGLSERHFKGIKKIPLGNSAKEGYDNLIKAFNNLLSRPSKSKQPQKNTISLEDLD